jgi:signal peptidase II
VPRKRLALGVNPTVIVVALVVTAIDAVSKAWARQALTGHDVHVAGSVWFHLQFNSGISFSINQSGPLVTTLITVLIALGVLVVGLRASFGPPTYGFGLLIGGGIANVIDRLAATPHEVTDFIALGGFPVFNLADASITAGFIVLFVCAVRGERLLTK